MRVPRRYSHFVFAVIQSGITTCIATFIAALGTSSEGSFVGRWTTSWLVSWGFLIPLVIVAAPVIRKLVLALTHDDA